VELRELRAFVAVVEEGGMSAAARRLHLSQPAISQTIHNLEKQLSVELLVRTTAGVSATPAGATLLAEARDLISRHQEVAASMAQHRAATNNTVRVGVPLSLPTGLLADALAGLASRSPTTTVTVRHLPSADQIASLRSGELDLGLIRERPSSNDLDVNLVVEEQLGVLLAAAQVERFGAPEQIRLDELAGLEWLGFPRCDSPAWYDELTATLRSHGVPINPSIACSEAPIQEVTFAAVSAGGVFAFAPASRRCALPDSVRWQRLSGNPVRRRTWAAWPANSRHRGLAHLVALLEEQTDAPLVPQP
jgi:DNA-binding transcriptional LysR family regulator